MKKAEIVFNVLLVPVDFFMIFLAGIAAYLLRFNKNIADIRPIVFDLPLEKYMINVFFVAIFFVAIFSILGLYSFRARRKIKDDFFHIIIGISSSIMMIVFYTFLVQEPISSRFIIVASWVLAIGFVFLGRIVLEKIRRWLVGKYGYGAHKVFIIGENPISAVLKKEFQNNLSLGYRVVAGKGFSDRFAAGGSGSMAGELLERQWLESFKKTCANAGVDEVIVTDLALPQGLIIELLEYCRVFHIDFKFVPDLLQAKTTNIDIDTINGVSLVEIKRTSLEGWGKVFKRIFDIIGAAAGIIIFSPVMIIAAIIIKLESKGPILYYSERVGVKRNFNVLKLRSMKADFCTGKQFGRQDDYALEYEKKLIKEKNSRKGNIYKIKNDPRVTVFGKFIRRSSIDELPQFFNVLAGQMSLVGPRPHQPREVLKGSNSYKGILQVKPGITGLAQVSGRSNLSTEEELVLDKDYVENWSLLRDLVILIKTIPAVVSKREAE